MSAPGTDPVILNERYKVIANYMAVNTDEMTIAVNDTITILQAFDDGWVLGRNEAIPEEGLIPRNFLTNDPIERASGSASGSSSSSPSEPKPLKRTSSFMKDPQVESIGSQQKENTIVEESFVGDSSKEPVTSTINEPISPPSVNVSIVERKPSVVPASTDVSQSSNSEVVESAIEVPPEPVIERQPSQIASATTTPEATNFTVAPPSPEPSLATAPTISKDAPVQAASTVKKALAPSSTINAPPPKPVKQITSTIQPLKQTILQWPPASSSSYTFPIVSTPGTSKLPRNPSEARQSTHLNKDLTLKKLEDMYRSKAGQPKVPANIGSIRISIVGDTGIGKTSLAKSFMSLPEIVSVETSVDQSNRTTKVISNYRASTIPVDWLKEGEERYNINMVDTPGFGAQIDAMVTIEPVVDFHATQFQFTEKIFEPSTKIPNITRFLSAGTGAHSHVDICIYGILHRLKPVDIEYMKRLAPVVNLIPVIVKSDTLKQSEISMLKVAILEEIQRAQIKIYGFGLEIEELITLAKNGIFGALPFAISNYTIENDRYLNEFQSLKDNILFHHIQDFRYLTAQRFAQWREKNVERELLRKQQEAAREAAERERREREERERVERERREREERMERERKEERAREEARAQKEREERERLEEDRRRKEAEEANVRRIQEMIRLEEEREAQRKRQEEELLRQQQEAAAALLQRSVSGSQDISHAFILCEKKELLELTNVSSYTQDHTPNMSAITPATQSTIKDLKDAPLETIIRSLKKDIHLLERDNRQLIKEHSKMMDSIRNVEDEYSEKVSYILKALDEAGRDRAKLAREKECLAAAVHNFSEEKEAMGREMERMKAKYKQMEMELKRAKIDTNDAVSAKEEMRRALIAIQHSTNAIHDTLLAAGLSGSTESLAETKDTAAVDAVESGEDLSDKLNISSALEKDPQFIEAAKIVEPAVPIATTLSAIQEYVQSLIDQRDHYRLKSERAYVTAVQSSYKLKPLLDRMQSGSSLLAQRIGDIGGSTATSRLYIGDSSGCLDGNGCGGGRVITGSGSERPGLDRCDSMALLERLSREQSGGVGRSKGGGEGLGTSQRGLDAWWAGNVKQEEGSLQRVESNGYAKSDDEQQQLPVVVKVESDDDRKDEDRKVPEPQEQQRDPPPQQPPLEQVLDQEDQAEVPIQVAQGSGAGDGPLEAPVVDNVLDQAADPKQLTAPPPSTNSTTSSTSNSTDLSGCRAFDLAASKPGTHFLGPKSQLASPESIASIPKQLFFIHYNDKLTNPRYLCSLESAAAQNPEHKIIVYARNTTGFRTSIERWKGEVLGVNGTGRFEVRELIWDDGMKGTPLQEWYRSGTYKKSNWVRQNLGNALRLALLWKFGGVYLDMDIISMNPISGVGRSLGKQDSFWFNNAFLSFPKADPFMWQLMEEFVAGFRGYIWARNGPKMVTRTFLSRCRRPPINGTAQKQAPECEGIGIADAERFYPIQFENRTLLFQPYEEACDTLGKFAEQSIGLHWWHRKVEDSRQLHKTTVLVKVMKSHCPNVFKVYGADGMGVTE
ncbi:Lactosylceramide 4-alpha-galactosyltransferase [Chytridiales sp. JEL 0842]|nr:Lactosylceramide 4-alpha-galactosyltransferase [Chytridiales sp. JEL 0842]